MGDSMDKVRVAVVGTGFMGAVHTRSARVAGGEVVGIVGSSPAKGKLAAQEFGVDRAFDSIEDVLRHGVDVVHVCTPNATHPQFAQAALEAGVAVICEKPLAVDADQAGMLTELAAERGVVAAVPFVYRYYASVREARARIAEPGHRPPWLIHGSYLQDWLADETATNWRVDPKAGGATRAFGDIGVHWCDLAEFVTGQRITRVHAAFGRAVAKRPVHAQGDGTLADVETEDGAVVMLETDSGAIGSVVVSQASAGHKNALSFSFDGPDATYAFSQETPESLWIGGRDHNKILLRDPTRPAATSVVGRTAALPAGHSQGYYECFADFVADTYAAVQGDAVPELPSFADGLRAARITEAVVTSARTRTWVDVTA